MSEGTGLPSGWSEAPLDVVAEVNPLRGALSTPQDAPVHFVPMASVLEEFGGADVSMSRQLMQVQKGYTAFRENDVLFAKITPCMENGKVAVVPRLEYGVGFGSTEFHVFRPTSAVIPRWVAHYLSQSAFRRRARRNMTGSAGQLRVPTAWLSDQRLPISPLAEQKRIVAKIEELFSDLDAAVASLKRAKANLKRYRASVLKSAVEGRLTDDWRREHPQTEDGQMLLERILRERRTKWETKQLAKFKEKGKAPPKNWKSKYKEPSAPDTSELPQLPEGWVWATADQVCVQVTDGEHNQPRYQEAGMPMLTATHVRHGSVSLERAGYIATVDYEKARARCAPMTGDVLIVCVGATTGRAGVVGEEFQFALVRSVLLLKPTVSGRYMLLWIDSPWTQAWIGTASGASAQAHFYITDAKRMPVPLPSLPELEQIVALVEERLSQSDAAEKTIDAELVRAKRLRQAILKQAFDGKLVPQDPSDEPASVLLERIRATRQQNQPKKKTKKVKAK